MKAITVRQPWAQAIAAGLKPVENRSRGFPRVYRGPLLIHAAMAWSVRGRTDPRIREHWHVLEPSGFPVGAIVATARLVDVHPDDGCCRPWGESEYVGADRQLHRGVAHLVLEDVEAFAHPVPCRGALGLWTPPPHVADLVA